MLVLGFTYPLITTHRNESHYSLILLLYMTEGRSH